MKALVSIVTNPIPLVNGVTPGKYLVVLTPKDTTITPQQQQVDAVTDPVTFDNLSAGDYTLTASRLDSNGGTIGTAVTTTFTVSAPPTQGNSTVDVPASLSVSLQ